MAKLYLAGNINGLSLGRALGWRDELKAALEALGHTALCPLRGKAKHLPTDQPLHGNYPAVVASAEAIVIRDLQDVSNCDGLLVNVGPREAVMTGSVCEVFCASQLRPRLPVFAFVVDGEEPCPQVRSPWFGGFFTPTYHVHAGLGPLLSTVRDYFG